MTASQDLKVTWKKAGGVPRPIGVFNAQDERAAVTSRVIHRGRCLVLSSSHLARAARTVGCSDTSATGTSHHDS